MSIELITILLFGSLVVCLALGLPFAWVMGGLAMVFTYFLWGPKAFVMVATQANDAMRSFIWVAMPLFIFMANMLQHSGVADDLYEMMHRWFGPVRGGLAMGTVVICTIFAAMSGVSSAGVITMGLIALPSMLKRNYDKKMAMGCIMAGGALGILIPPSAMMIVYSFMVKVSLGQLFMGGVFPGLILSALFIIYIGIRSFLQPHMGPALPKEERATWRQKLTSLRAVIIPIFLIISVLGTIFIGMASPSEAAALGALAASYLLSFTVG